MTMPAPAPPVADSTPITTSRPVPAAFDRRDLDELIPPPLSPWRKLGVALILVSLASTFLVLSMRGVLSPAAPNQGNIAAYGPTYFDAGEGLVAVTVRLENRSSRELRLTNVDFESSGAEVVRVEAALLFEENPTDNTDGSGDFAVQTVPVEEFFAVPDAVALPVVLPVRDDSTGLRPYHEILIWLRPTSCVDPTSPWGFVEVTVDFGDGAFPPFPRTYRGTDQVWTGGEVNMWGGDGFVNADGPLALACEVLR